MTLEYQYLKVFIQNILGTYTPVTTGEGIGTVDFAYVFAGILFLMFLHFIFKCMFSLLIKK